MVHLDSCAAGRETMRGTLTFYPFGHHLSWPTEGPQLCHDPFIGCTKYSSLPGWSISDLPSKQRLDEPGGRQLESMYRSLEEARMVIYRLEVAS